MEDENKKEEQDENYVLENVTQELEMIKDDTVPVSENTLSAEELTVDIIKKEEEEMNSAPVVAPKNDNAELILGAEAPTTAPVVNPEPTTAPVPTVEPASTEEAVKPEGTDEAPVSEEPKKKSSKLPVIILLLLLVSAVVGLVIFIMGNNSSNNKPEEKPEEKEEEKKEEEPKEEDFDLEEAKKVYENYFYDDYNIKDDEKNCNGKLSIFFKDSDVDLSKLSDEVISSYIVRYAISVKAEGATEPKEFMLTKEEFGEFAKKVFGKDYAIKDYAEAKYEKTVCSFDEETQKYSCLYTPNDEKCNDGNVSEKLIKATIKGDELKLTFKVVFKNDNKFYSDYAKTVEIAEATTVDDAMDKLEKENYTMTFKKESNKYIFVSANLVK